jgi:hypothetical protein
MIDQLETKWRIKVYQETKMKFDELEYPEMYVRIK